MRKKIRKPVEPWQPWLHAALQVLKPPERLTVSQWADRYRVLDSKSSSEPGQWATDRTPYLRGIMDALTDPKVEEVVFVKPTQVGGTEALNNMLGYVIAQDPSPALFVYPTLELAQYTSKNRMQPMCELSPVLRNKFRKDESKELELQFDGMYVVFAGANSPASLASRPIRFLFMDEVDKYPRSAGKEADPRSLARERTKTFPFNKKIVQTSTPTLKNGPIWKAYENTEVKMQYYVPCPHCGHYQTFKFKGGIVFERKLSPENARHTAYYECEGCKQPIRDLHKPMMLRNGEWRTADGKTKKATKTGYWINAIYSPWVRFGDVVYAFLTSKQSPEELMNFVNSWLAEPWENTQVKLSSDKVLKQTSGYDEGIVPDRTIFLTGGVDVQKDRFFYTVRAWGDKMTSWNVRHGMAETWTEIEEVMNTPYYSRDGTEYFVNLCGIDSGYNADETYSFCVTNGEWAVAVKGSSNEIPNKYRMTKIDREDKGMYNISLYLVYGHFYKDFIANRINRKSDDAGGWFVHENCDLDYAEQVTNEHKVTIKRNGREIDVWQPKTSHAANHYLDAEVYAAFAADRLGIRYAKYEPPTSQDKQVVKKPKINNAWTKGGSWL